tara:strand:- start:612 stop:1019 length:408 start_codon:yes stop_codon:yes gene_type:complete
MSRIGQNRLARTNVIAAHPTISITESALNDIIANITTTSQSIQVEQFFRAFVALDVVSSTHNTISVANVQDAIEQLESQFSRGATDPSTSSETYLDNGDLFYNTNTNQLKVYRDGVWQILLQAEGDMDTLDGSTF